MHFVTFGIAKNARKDIVCLVNPNIYYKAVIAETGTWANDESGLHEGIVFSSLFQLLFLVATKKIIIDNYNSINIYQEISTDTPTGMFKYVDYIR